MLRDPAWSPDGKTIVCLIHGAGALSGLVAIDPLSEANKLLSLSKLEVPPGKPVCGCRWQWSVPVVRRRNPSFPSPDMREIYNAGDVPSRPRHQRLFHSSSVATDGRTLAAVLQQSHRDLFVQPASRPWAAAKIEQLTSGAPVSHFWTPDGQMILEQDYTLFAFNPESRSRTSISSPQDGGALEPAACADGRYVVSTIAGHSGAVALRVWRMDTGSDV